MFLYFDASIPLKLFLQACESRRCDLEAAGCRLASMGMLQAVVGLALASRLRLGIREFTRCSVCESKDHTFSLGKKSAWDMKNGT